MSNLITITTDFGDSFAPAQLKAVVATLGYTGRLIENHSVSALCISEGAFQILTLSKFSPGGTIHLGVVDPGVGSRRHGIIIKSNNFYFVGPDNGLLYPAALEDKITTVWRIKESSIGGKISNTFHGRDVFIKVAVYLAQGKKPADFGSIVTTQDTLKKIIFKPGEVLHVDPFGNIKIYWPRDIRPGATLILFHKGITSEILITKTFSDVAEGTTLALLGSSNTLEIAINMASAAAYYGVKVGDVLTIKKTGRKV